MTALDENDPTQPADSHETDGSGSPIYTGLVDELGDPTREPSDTE